MVSKQPVIKGGMTAGWQVDGTVTGWVEGEMTRWSDNGSKKEENKLGGIWWTKM